MQYQSNLFIIYMYNKYIAFIVNESKLSLDERDVTIQEFGYI